MQIRSLPFWLMMVSMARAVLPVCRSPMIELALTAPDGDHGIDRLDARLHRRVHALADDHVGRNALDGAELVRLDRSFAVHRLAQGVDDAADHAAPDRHRDDAPRAADRALGDAGGFAHDDDADVVGFQVEDDARVPFANSTSSEAWLVRPLRRAMPSPTRITVPTSTVRVGAWKLRICCLSCATRSSVRTAMNHSLLDDQSGALCGTFDPSQQRSKIESCVKTTYPFASAHIMVHVITVIRVRYRMAILSTLRDYSNVCFMAASLLATLPSINLSPTCTIKPPSMAGSMR